jgi:hypothetical protein
MLQQPIKSVDSEPLDHQIRMMQLQHQDTSTHQFVGNASIETTAAE